MYLIPEPHFDDVKESFLGCIRVEFALVCFYVGYTGVGRRAGTDSAARLYSHMSGDVGQNADIILDISRSFHIHM